MSTFTHDTKDTADTSVLLVKFEIHFSHCCIATLMESFFHNYSAVRLVPTELNKVWYVSALT